MKTITIMLLLVILSAPATADTLYVHDFGNGTYVATSSESATHWIVKFYYWLQDLNVSFGPDPECEVSPAY